ncbi:uncharacterized protein LOC106670106 isoform X5 [Cimex lectularius]|uniref:Uncharacterized protein n=1 Tax=Cimex lectularius TaxID=79782 RepID=A0A8I6S2F7_CIMLE|nr:uncharacterized protein LOC106670106 isoform X5 [Cimex lectularius]
MAKRDGDDNLSPEMQAKMQAAKKLQDELNAKLSQFGQIASNKNMSSVKEYDDLEKELLELKKYAASVKNENDAKLNDMINAMNKKMEKMAKTALEEQEVITQNILVDLEEIKVLYKQLISTMEQTNWSVEELQIMKEEYDSFKLSAEEVIKGSGVYLREIKRLLKKVDKSDKAKITTANYEKKIDQWLEAVDASRECRLDMNPFGLQIVQRPSGSKTDDKKR